METERNGTDRKTEDGSNSTVVQEGTSSSRKAPDRRGRRPDRCMDGPPARRDTTLFCCRAAAFSEVRGARCVLGLVTLLDANGSRSRRESHAQRGPTSSNFASVEEC
ncbi:hypothetical protein TNCV_2294321 [Trichonephila clavipes]|nr:hypothetical protein TNCV_2294321 [Trichonephila clavipes]